MGEAITVLTSATSHALAKSFGGPEVSQQYFSTGSLFKVSEEGVSALKSLSGLLHKLENEPNQTIIRGSLAEGKAVAEPSNIVTTRSRLRVWLRRRLWGNYS